MNKQIPVLLCALLGVLSVAHATDSPYAGQEKRAIKALSEQEIDDYVSGRGMGTSKAAELNHYPGPRHVLDHKFQLGLTQDQVTQAQRLYEDMADDAARLGKQIVQKEADLEALYSAGKANRHNTRELVHELAMLQAEFRLVHLNAHLSMKQLLSPQQVAAYDQLRGYGSAPHRHGRHPHH